MKHEQCPICGQAAAHQDMRDTVFEYKGHNFTIKQPALWCDSCGEGIISPEDNKMVLEEIQTHRARIDGILAPAEIAAIRKHLRLNQKQAGIIFGGGVNAFNRYERGINPVPKPLSMLLYLLDKHPEQLKEIAPANAIQTMSQQ